MTRFRLLPALIAGVMLALTGGAAQAARIESAKQAIATFVEASRRGGEFRKHMAWAAESLEQSDLKAQRLSEAEVDGFRVRFSSASPPPWTSFRADVLAVKIHDLWRVRVRERGDQSRRLSAYIEGATGQIVLIQHAPAPYF
jgi:hypothetical protein